MKKKQFGEELFSQTFDCDTYEMGGTPLPGDLYRLLDHGFVANRACCWDDRLEGHELAVIARTYCDDDTIDNPPEGLRCVRLPPAVLGSSPGTAIAVVIDDASEAAEAILSACTYLPAHMLAYMISSSMADRGYWVGMSPGPCNFPVVHIAKAFLTEDLSSDDMSILDEVWGRIK